MPGTDNLIVYREARELLRLVVPIADTVRFGDLSNQMRRAAISVVSNIAEGAALGSDRQLVKFLRIARGSVNELLTQLEIAGDLGIDSQSGVALARRVGKRPTVFIRTIDPG